MVAKRESAAAFVPDLRSFPGRSFPGRSFRGPLDEWAGGGRPATSVSPPPHAILEPNLKRFTQMPLFP